MPFAHIRLAMQRDSNNYSQRLFLLNQGRDHSGPRQNATPNTLKTLLSNDSVYRDIVNLDYERTLVVID